MSPWIRIAIGAAFGALIVLFVHPVSRPYVFSALISQGPSPVVASSRLLPENLEVLPEPSDVVTASLWMQTGASRLRRRDPIPDSVMTALISLAESAGAAEPENAFWPQMAAVFLNRSGREVDAYESWIAASKCLNWNDHQSERLSQVREQLANKTGVEQGWHSAAMYYRRVTYCAGEIERYGRSLLNQSGLESKGDLLVRFYTLRNGAILRDGSRSISVGMSGVNLVELASLPPRLSRVQSPRKLLVSRYDYIDALRDQGLGDEVTKANTAFNDNEAWLALLLKERPDETMKDWSLLSVATSVLPSALLLTSFCGWIFVALAAILERYPKLHAIARHPIAPVIGLSLAIGIYALTQLWLLSITAVACFSFVAFGPEHERTSKPKDLGPFFAFTLILIAAVFGLCVATFFSIVSSPASEVFVALDVTPEFVPIQTLPLGLACIVLSIVLLVAPSWAIVQRISTPYVFTLAIRSFGHYLAVGFLLAAIISAPIAIYVDTQLSTQMTMALLNEPSYYFTR